MKIKKLVAWSLSAVILLSVNVHDATAAEHSSITQNKATVIVDGKTTEGVVAFNGNGILSVQLAPIVKAMGDSIKWDATTQTAIVTQNNKTIIKVMANKSIAKVNDKDVILVTKMINNVIVPTSAKAVIVNGSMFLPFEALKNVFGYNVQVEDKGSEKSTSSKSTIKSVVKEDSRYPFPGDGWTPPQINSTWSSDKQKNMQVLEDELGFVNKGSGAIFSPYGKKVGSAAILLSAEDNERYDTAITFKYWHGSKHTPLGHEIPYISREIFEFYLPQKGGVLWGIIDDGYNKKDISKYINKKFTLEDREIKIMETANAVVVIIGKPGIKYDDDWKIIK